MSGGTTEQSALSLPKGGGAVKSIGESFQANLFTGTGNFSVPIYTSPGRSGFAPKLTLDYSTGSGNSPFGLGWQLSIPRITRKTEKGLPRYDNHDVFVMSGAEDLVPCLELVIDPSSSETTWQPEPPMVCGDFTIARYRPRTEGLFSRIERWVRIDGDTHWRITTKDNITNIYGRTETARIADPENPLRVYEWLLQESFDAKGNHILYEYACEDAAAVPASLFERNRTYGQLYIRRILYGNTNEMVGPRKRGTDHQNPLAEVERSYVFEVFFDYGDLQTDAPVYSDQPERTTSAWRLRPDPFSLYRAGFEVRTLRLCQRVIMFHHFSELGGATRVKSTDFEYLSDPNTQLSFLSSVTVTGYRRQGTVYRSASLPPITFEYSQFKPHTQRYQSISAEGDQLPSSSLSNRNLALVDLFGRGLPDVLETTAQGFRYWRNLGSGRLARPRMMVNAPSTIMLDQPDVRFADVNGNGRADLLVLNGVAHGFYETDGDGDWKPFKPIPNLPNFSLSDSNARLLDLNGDGLTDVLVTRDRHFLWFECQGEAGYMTPQSVQRVNDLDQFPDVYFDDPSGRVRVADMNGDGLSNIVLVHNGRVDYWPNLGYGRFGKRITMATAPRLESEFDPSRLYLVDLDGSGCSDLVYVDRDCVRFWFNRCGNSWSEENVIRGTPLVSGQTTVEFADFFGTGTTALLWSCDQDIWPGGNYKVLDFCGGKKPYLLVEMSNNMGATTRVQYTSAADYYLEDEANGQPWLTRLPFPVQVLAQVETLDHISRTKLVTTYKYHHGYFDGREREFRGFGRVDQFDTQMYEDFVENGLFDDSLYDNPACYHLPPVEKRTWYHTGVYFDTTDAGDAFDYEDLTARYRQTYYQGDPCAFTLGEHTVEIGTTPHEAYRVLRGATLRTELYAHDGTARAAHPYQVTENRYHVHLLQPRAGNTNAVFLTTEAESVSYQYERKPDDPRISHQFTLRVDGFGNITDAVTVYYPRRSQASPLTEQAELKAIYTHTDFINAVDQPNTYYVGMVYQVRTYEVTGVMQTNASIPLQATDFGVIIADPADFLPYHQQPTPGIVQKRLVEWTRTYYRTDADPGILDAPLQVNHRLDLGMIEHLGLLYETYSAALTAELVTEVYGTDPFGSPCVTVDMLREGGYHADPDTPNIEWIPGGRAAYDETGFYLPVCSQDAFGNITQTVYDRYDLLIEQVIDPLNNTVQATNDYRVSQPWQITDPNGDVSEVAYDALGLVAASALRSGGDSLTGAPIDLSPLQLDAVYASGGDSSLLGSATSVFVYDIHRYEQDGEPNFVLSLAREIHTSDLNGAQTPVQRRWVYADGFGREVQTKIQAEPGEVGGAPVQNRWVGTGWTIYNNKGKAVQKYEPFFSQTHHYEFNRRDGVTSTLFYDPLGRVVATLHPNHTYEKVVFDAWTQASWDANDTVRLDPRTDADVGGYISPYLNTLPGWQTWLRERINPDSPPSNPTPEQAAAVNTLPHAATPAVEHLDSLGRTFLIYADNGTEGRYATRLKLDIEGNTLTITDALNRVILTQQLDLSGALICSDSCDAGLHRMLNDAAGKPMYAWNANGHITHTTCDGLRRPRDLFTRQETQSDWRLAGHMVYGESSDAGLTPEQITAGRLRGRPYRQYDGVGVLTFERYDFKGNTERSYRTLIVDYTLSPDWSNPPALETESHVTETRYDALKRPSLLTAPDGSQVRPAYNLAGLLDRIEVRLPGGDWEAYVTNVDYNAHGRRERIVYGNGIITAYTYDPLTYRFTNLLTTRGATILQNPSYTYDPAGNITAVVDAAQPTVFFDNQVVTASSSYVYDALYRLVSADGREHIGQVSAPWPTWDDAPRLNQPLPGDGQAMRRYHETYTYDAVGNIENCAHQAGNTVWTRAYEYTPGTNRLLHTTIGGTTSLYQHDNNGNMTALDGMTLTWDFKDQLECADLGGGGLVYYTYDTAGQRARKVAVKNNGALVEERIYLGAFEIFRRRTGSGLVLQRNTLTIMDDKCPIALIETRVLGDELPEQLIRYQFDNHLGSACLELDQDANLISYEEYYPYGSTSYHAVRSGLEANPKRYRYTGKERDSETGLYYHGARYYAPWLARWLATDPTPRNPALSLYQYCANSPVTLHDPTGMQEKIGVSSAHFGYTLDHLISQFNAPGMSVDPANIKLTIGSDNFSKGAGNAVVGTYVTESLAQAQGLDAFRKVAARMLALPLDATKELNELWQEASRGQTNKYKTSQANFFRLLLKSQSTSAQLVRRAFSEANITLDPTTGRPRLDPLRALGVSADTLTKMMGERANPTQRMARAFVSQARQRLASAGSTAKGVGGALKQTAKSLIPGGEILDWAKLVGGGSTMVGLRTMANYTATVASRAATSMVSALGAEVGTGTVGTVAMTTGSVVAAAGGVTLLGTTAYAASTGQTTPVEVADKFYGTKFSDMYSWSKQSVGIRIALDVLTMGGFEGVYQLNQYVEKH